MFLLEASSSPQLLLLFDMPTRTITLVAVNGAASANTVASIRTNVRTIPQILSLKRIGKNFLAIPRPYGVLFASGSNVFVGESRRALQNVVIA